MLILRQIKRILKFILSLHILGPDLRTSVHYKDIGPSGPLVKEIFSHISSVPGAFNVDDVGHFHIILSMQSVFGLRGDLLEIGSYHGRSCAVMAKYLKQNERIHICDAFSLDTEDRYGNKPTPEILISNIERINHDRIKEQIIIHECLSNDLRFEEDQKFRFVHIDGGHSEEQTLFDLNLVKSVLPIRGVVVVDDYHHKNWPGVTPAVDRFLKDNKTFIVLADLNRHGAKGRKIYIMKKD